MESKFIETAKKILGIVWIGLSLFIIYDTLISSNPVGKIDIIQKITSNSQADNIFGWILLLLLLPLISGVLFLFGYLAIKGEYAKD